MPFGNKEVFEVLKNSEKGDLFYIGRTKNTDGFWDWDKISEVPNSQEAYNEEVGHKQQTKAAPAASKTTPWETPEDRAQKQLYIIRQSSLTNAVNTLVGNVNPEDVKSTAQNYIDFVLGIAETPDYDDIL